MALARALGPNGPAHRQRRPRAGVRDRQTTAGHELPPQDAQNLFSDVPPLPRRLRAQRASAPRCYSMICNGWMRNARPLEHLVTHPEVPAPAAGRRLPGQRGRPRAPVSTDAGGDPRVNARVHGSCCAPRDRRCWPAHRRRAPLRPGARAAILAELVQEKDGGIRFSRSSSLSRCRRGCSHRHSRVSLAMEHRSHPRKSYTDNVVDLMVEKLKRCLPPPGKPEAVGLLGNVVPIATLALVSRDN